MAVIQLIPCKTQNYCRVCQIHQSRERGWRTSECQAGWFRQARFEVCILRDDIVRGNDGRHNTFCQEKNRRLVESRRMHVQNTIKCSRTYNTRARSCISVQSWPESTCYVRLPSFRSLSKVSFVMRGSADVGSNISVRYSDRCGVICGHAEWLILMIRPPDTVVMQHTVGYSNDKNGNTICRLAFMRSKFQFTELFIPTYCNSICQYNSFSNMFRLIYATIIWENTQGSYLFFLFHHRACCYQYLLKPTHAQLESHIKKHYSKNIKMFVSFFALHVSVTRVTIIRGSMFLARLPARHM